VKRVDDEIYIQRFTPRTGTSKWSNHNIRRAEQMIAARKMTRAGMAAYRELVENPESRMVHQDSKIELAIHPEFAKAMTKNLRAREHFRDFPPSYRRNCLRWINTAKKEETRRKRITQIVRLAARGEKIRMV